jgi:hypothetical protein
MNAEFFPWGIPGFIDWIVIFSFLSTGFLYKIHVPAISSSIRATLIISTGDFTFTSFMCKITAAQKGIFYLFPIGDLLFPSGLPAIGNEQWAMGNSQCFE